VEGFSTVGDWRLADFLLGEKQDPGVAVDFDFAVDFLPEGHHVQQKILLPVWGGQSPQDFGFSPKGIMSP